MFGFLRKSTGGVAAEPATLQAELEQLEQQMVAAPPAERASLLIKAAERCARAQEAERSRVYHCRAIDAYIEAGDAETAASLCRKLVVSDSSVVRARGTLATLLVQAGAEGEALLAIRDYARVARRTGTQQHAVARLRALADETANPRIRGCIRENLFALGARQEANEVQETPAASPAIPPAS